MRLFDDRSRGVDRFGLLLLVTFSATVTLSLVDFRSGAEFDAGFGLVFVSLFVGAALILALRASGLNRRYRLVAETFVAVVTITTFSIVIGGEAGTVVPAKGAPIVWGLLSVFAPLAVIRRLTRHSRATIKTLLGALSAYLLIALTFDFAYLAIDAHRATPFFGNGEPSTSFMYYSLVTLTTLGYGDLATTSQLGRLLSTIEAVVGQVYLVTFVAMIVGLLVNQRQRAGKESR